MGKLKEREVSIFLENFKSLNIAKKLPGGPNVQINFIILPEFKVKDFGLFPLSLSENIFGFNIFICEPILKNFVAHFRTK